MGLNQCDNTPELFVLQVLGDSMLPEFQEGDIIIVDPGLNSKHEKFVVMECQGEYSFSQYIVKNDEAYLTPLHPDHPTEKVTKDHKLKGVVVQKKRRKQKVVHYDYE